MMLNLMPLGMTPGAYRQRFGLRTSRKQWAGPEH